MDERKGASDEVDARAVGQGLVTKKLPGTIVRDEYTPALLGLLSNVLVWGGSRVIHKVHGVGTNEWRIISGLGNHPGATSGELCEILGINKSIASKSVNVLLGRDLVAQINGPRGSRHLYLTPEGARVHDDLMPIAIKRQEILHESLTPEEVVQLNSLLVRMLSSAEAMQRYEAEMLAADGSGEPGEASAAGAGVTAR
ncbi:DNA-binding MarR family transcriptional regulator [Arthrobacter sp. V4I6]|uniref:MarR family winged helix-turn-helix transcriptional regulator n=1 Tax=Arthrobacter sp. V4I6 TaxID=3042281 RepID=UPI00278B7C07|nr:MarR family winged helix-turn-helix transcriptional regulator [Arthrobacter sp. V4I6]MDQ0855706.1 DNA-binding MarR family transcriptional regulator [Arthrobacter sp. V4I6]